jgi:Tol biopolymer transport system component
VSPDGDRLVYFEGEADFDIVALGLDAVEVTPLIATENREEQAAWAADVPAMVYLSTRNGRYAIWLHRQGDVDRPLVSRDDFPTPHWLFSPSLSPDGTRIIYQVVDQAGSSHLWMLGVAGGSPERVTDGADEHAGSWSPDGAWYVFWRKEPDGANTLQKVKTTGRATPETLLAGARQSPVLPIWAPDGDWILVADRGMKLVSPDGKTTRELGIENAPCGFARAERLIYCLRAPREDGQRLLVALDFEGQFKRVVGAVSPDYAPASSAGAFAPSLTLSLAPDGSRFVYSTVTRSQELWLMEGLSEIALP